MYVKDIEAAKYIGVAVQTIRNWRGSDNGPPYYKVSGSVRYSLNDIDDWMRSHCLQSSGAK